MRPHGSHGARWTSGTVAGADPDRVGLAVVVLDHLLAHDASALLVRRRPDLMWFTYADALYRQIPGLVAQRLQEQLLVVHQVDDGLPGAQPPPVRGDRGGELVGRQQVDVTQQRPERIRGRRRPRTSTGG